MYRQERNGRLRKQLTAFFFSTLLSSLAAPVFAAEILHLPYRYSSDTRVAIEATETFVLCDCKEASALAVKPKEVPISLKMTEPFHFSLPTPVKEEPIQGEGGSAGEARIKEAEPDSMKAAAGDDSEPLIIGFGFNEKSPAREKELLQAVERIKKSGKEVRVFGHTCDLGGRERNERISLSRAENVAALLKEHGIGVAEVAGMGSCCPRSTDRRKNRRVEIFIVNGGDHEK
ncbi:MAG: OmpA family protein [Candidatus Manganitrophaceae bacterium]|nr:MAG: OmpA family protein [Candidatus Manganitrophaceae bacterium]